MSMGSRKLTSLVQTPSNLLTYHQGTVLHGDIPISIFWYGKFTPSQKSILTDFLLSLNPTSSHSMQPMSPTVSRWWTTIDNLYISKEAAGKKTNILLATQVSDESCSMGKSLSRAQISTLAAKDGTKNGGIAVVLTAEDVAVEGFCRSNCGSHGSDLKTGSAYIWVGNSAAQCPGQCAWPLHQPAYGPQGPALVAPNGDVGVDGMVINLASIGTCNSAALGDTVTLAVYALLMTMAIDVARELGIPSVLFWIQPAAVFAIYHYYFHGYAYSSSTSGPRRSLRAGTHFGNFFSAVPKPLKRFIIGQ